MECITGIYLITHIATGRPYVGLTGMEGGFEARWYCHRSELRRNMTINTHRHLQNAWNKYGENAFEFSIHTRIPQGSMDDNEFYKLLRSEESRIAKLYLKTLNSTEPGEGGMRRSPDTRKRQGASLSKRYKEDPEFYALKKAQNKASWTPERKRKTSIARTGTKRSPETCANISAALFKTMSNPEVRAKISRGNKGKKRTLEHIERSSKFHKERCNTPEGKLLMKKISNIAHSNPEVKAKMYVGFKGRTHTPESRAKTSASSMGKQKGKIVSAETREKIRLSLKGRPLSPENIAKKIATCALKRQYQILVAFYLAYLNQQINPLKPSFSR